MDLFLFSTRVRETRSAAPILALLRSQVLPRVAGPALGPYLGTLMTAARRFNEDLGDVDSAIALWSEVHRLSPDPDRRKGAMLILMAVASKKAHTSLKREQRDAVGAASSFPGDHQVAHLAAMVDGVQPALFARFKRIQTAGDTRLPPARRGARRGAEAGPRARLHHRA